MPHPAEPFDFDEVYDPETMAALDAWMPVEDEASPVAPLASRLGAWSRSSSLGMMLSASALALQQVLYPDRDEAIVIEVDAEGEPHDLPIRLLLDPDDPRGSLCIVRRDPPPPMV